MPQAAISVSLASTCVAEIPYTPQVEGACPGGNIIACTAGIRLAVIGIGSVLPSHTFAEPPTVPEDASPREILAAVEQHLGDAHFPHRLDVELAAALELTGRARAARDGAVSPLADYLDARIAGLGGSYERAGELARRAIPNLDPARADVLRALEPFWDVMRYSQSDGLIHYDEDLQMVLPGGPLLAHTDTSTPEVYRLKEQTAALLNLATISPILVMTSEQTPVFDEIGRQAFAELTRAFCDTDRPCPEAELLAVQLQARLHGPESGYGLGAAAAGAFAEAENWPMSASAWLRAGDAALDPVSSPFELGLRPLNTVTSTMALNAGRSIVEFQPAPREAIDVARSAYDNARAAHGREASARVAAHLTFREGLLAWRNGRDDAALAPMRAAVEQFTAAGDARAAFRAAAAHAIVAELAGADHELRRRARGAPYGLRLGAVRLLSKASAYALYARSDVNASYRLRELAIGIARDLQAPQIQSAQLAEQGSFLISLGQQRSGIILLEEAVDLNDRYLEAIPGIALYSDSGRREQAIQVANQVRYAQVLDLVNAALSLEDLPLARKYNARLDALEQAGVVTMLGPLAGANEVLIEIRAGDYELALRLARQRNDTIQEALALILLEREDEAADVLQRHIDLALSSMARVVDSPTPADALEYQRARNEVEQALSLLLRSGKYELAQEFVDRTNDRIGEHRLFVDSAKAWEADHFRAQLAAGLGYHEEALGYYEAAMSHVREWADQVGDTQSAVRFDSEIAYLVNDYIQYLLLEHDPRSGLRELERFRARDSREALIASAQLTGASRDLLSRWQRDEAALQIALRAAAAGESVPSERVEAQRRAALASRGELLNALGSPADDGIDLDAVQAKIEAEELTLFVYHLYGDRSSVTALRPGRAPEVRRLKIPGYELRRLVGRMEADMLSADVAWRGTARRLYAELIEPAEDLLPPSVPDGHPLLGIVAFEDVHRVPFEALVKEGAPLVSRFDLFHAPSLLSFLGHEGSADKAAGRSVRAVGFNGDRLRHAEEEARIVDERAAVGPAATRGAFLDLLEDGVIVHAAVHAQPGVDNPYFTLLGFADGDLYLHELLGREMIAPLLVLSACDTASAERLRSDQAIGLATTFIENGVDNIVVTRWAIDDEFTVPLIRDFYAGLSRGYAPARALGNAQRNALRQGGARAHPSFWAAFHLIGSP
jgi:CHAT domain-containing protein